MFGVPRFVVLAALVALPPVQAAPWFFPPIDGELAGDATVLAGAPKLHWTMAVQTTDTQRRHVLATAQGEGIQLRLEIDIDLETGAGRWTLVDGVADARVWLPVLAKQFAGIGVTGTGQFRLAGNGTINRSVVTGAVQGTFGEVVVKNEADGWTLDGVSGSAEIAFDSATGVMQTTTPAQMAVRTLSTSRFGARNLAVTAQLRPDGKVAIDSAHVEIAGGEASIAPCVVSVHPMDARFEANLRRVGLQDIAQFFPDLVVEASGRMDGQVRMHWSEQSGLEIGSAKLMLSQNEPAELRLAPRPGLLSGSVSTRIRELVNALRRIEMGEAPLRAEALEVVLTPAGDAEGRTGRVRLKGAPVDPGIVAPVDLNVNMRGPLDVALRAFTGTKLKFAE